MSKDNFYIGWKDDMSSSTKSFLKKRIIIIAAIALMVSFLLVFSQKGFNDHYFQLGKITEISGTYFEKPYPMLVNAMVDGTQTDVLLVGYGKAGALTTMQMIEENEGSLNGKTIKIQGTLIKGKGKTLMELTRKEDSFLEITESEVLSTPTLEKGNEVTLEGEILDPKCYFGVMKPGEGKIHKSCAIRCISGGIPPVFRTGYTEAKYEFYLMLGPNGEFINKEILSHVGEQTEVTGLEGSFSNWKVLYFSVPDIRGLEGYSSN